MLGFEIVGQLLCGWLLADFLSGVAHWYDDTFLEWPSDVDGEKLHHVDPKAITFDSVLSRNWISWTLTAIAGVGLVMAFGMQLWVCAAIVGGIVVNEIHVMNHRPRSGNKVLTVLQETGLVQSHRAHAKHHKINRASFCVLTNYLNPVLNEIGFWRHLSCLFGK